jgi:hypothetical protein
MPTLSRTPKPDPTRVYQALDGYIYRPARSAQDVTVIEGQRLRGDHPTVIDHPELWAPADLPDDELHELQQARITAAIARAG